MPDIRREKAYTLVELMIVITIVGILAAIAVPQYSAYRVKACNTAAEADLRNAFKAAQSYFAENATGTVTPALLASNGYRRSTGVNLTIIDGTLTGLSMTASHDVGAITYSIDHEGIVTH